MTREEPAFLAVGYVSKPHGMRGELFVQLLTDHPDDLFSPGVTMRPGDTDGQEPDPHLSALRVEEARPFQKGWLVSFHGVDSRDAADLLRGRYLMVERERLPALADGEVFYHQLLGMEVVTAQGYGWGKSVKCTSFSLRTCSRCARRRGPCWCLFLTGSCGTWISRVGAW